MADFAYCLNASTIKTTPILEQIRVTGQAVYKAIELWHDGISATSRKARRAPAI